MTGEVHRTLVLLRHGQTAWNATGRAQGLADIPLDETGRAQAAAVAPLLAGLHPVLLWTSDLDRAVETAGFVAAATGLTARRDARLREYDVGERSGLTVPEAAAAYGMPGAGWWQLHESGVVPGTESTAAVAERLLPALLEAMAALGVGETGVVITHGAALKVGIAGLLDWPVELSQTLQGVANCGWAVVTQAEGGSCRLSGYGLAAPGFASAGDVG